MNRVAGILLAAGRGTRFGGGKLAAMLAGVPLAHHAARTMRQMPLAWHLAVISGGAPPPGFRPVHNDQPEMGQSRSLALGVEAARRMDAEAVLIMLADMPFVSPGHLDRLLACHDGDGTLAASTVELGPQPPALVGRRWFPQLAALTADRGARDLLADAVMVQAGREELMDIDTPDDLDRARRLAERQLRPAIHAPEHDRPRGSTG